MSGNKYFYMATVKHATSVTQCIKANYTYSPLSQEEILEQRSSNQMRSSHDRNSMHKLDTNIIIAKSNMLSVMKITENQLEAMFELPFNDQIIHILKVPVANILEQRAGRDQSGLQQQDFIFVLTAEFNCILLGYNTTQGPHSISNGNISDNIGQKREPPFSVFLGPSGKYICLMIYENVIKVIPIMKMQSNKISLSNAFNVRIRHPDVNSIIPLFEHDAEKGATFGVFYQQQSHRTTAQGHIQVQMLKFKRYELNLADKDIIDTQAAEDICDFDNTNVYKVFPLDFGGFIAFEPDYVHVYRRKVKCKIISKKLRSQMLVKAICNIDQYNPVTKLTEQGQSLMRYLVATEHGELYMLGFYLDHLHLATGTMPINQQEANEFVIIEFLGSKLSSCSTLQYIDNGYIFYGSKLGDSLLIQLMAENQGDKDRPYIQIVQTYANLGPIQDLAFRKDHLQKGQQNELLLVGGTFYNSHISVIKKGISVKKLLEIDSMPQLASNGLFNLGDKLFLKFNGVDQLIGLQIVKQNEEFTINDYIISDSLSLDVSRNEFIIALEQAMINDEIVYVFVTNHRIRVMPYNLSEVVMEFNAKPNQEITNASINKNKILVSIQQGIVLYFNTSEQKENEQRQQLIPNNQYPFEHDVSSIALSDKSEFASVALWDAPYYSLFIIHPQSMTIIAKRAAACYVDQDQFAEFSKNIEIRDGMTIDNDCDMMQIETSSKESTMASLNTHYSCSAIVSMQIVSLGDQDFIICGLGNGKILQLNLELQIALQIINQPESFPPQLSLSLFDSIDFEKTSKHDIPSVLWNIQVNTIGDQEIVLKKLTNKDGEQVVLVCCDKPAIFFSNRETLRMQYINELYIQQACIMTLVSDKPLFIFENKVGAIVLSEMDPLQNLQLYQTHFDLEVTKTAVVPSDEYMVVLQEQPNYEYLNKNDQKYNKIALLNKYTQKQYASYDLEFSEIAICITYVEKRMTGTLNIANKAYGRYMLVGTAYMDLHEQMPSKGRLLIFEINSHQQKLDLVFTETLQGSIQAIATIKEDHKYLILGINNEVKLYQFNLKSGPHFTMEELQSKSTGAFIAEIKVFQNTIVVGDIMKAIMLYDFKEGRAVSNKMLSESAHSNESIWTNCVLPLSLQHFMLFDKEKNMFIFERILLPTNDQEKLKLNLVGCIRVGEEVTKAVFGTLNIQSGSALDKDQGEHGKQKSYISGASKTRQAKKKLEKDVIMSEQIERQVEDMVDDEKLKSDKDYVKQICTLALKDVKQPNQGQIIMFGTQEGSLGTLIEIPERAYKFLNLLNQVMEKEGITDLGKLSRKGFRTVKTDSLKRESFNIIDGDFIEMFLELESKQTNLIIQHLLSNSRDYTQQYLKDIKSLIEALKDQH